MCPLPSSHDGILDAAQVVVLEVGAAHMTLDAVATKAGVSKAVCFTIFQPKRPY